MSSLTVLAFVATCWQSPAATPKPLEQLPPRRPIAGLAGFQSISTLVYDADPTHPHVLETIYVFPERVRWRLSLRGGDPSVRHLEYRCGKAYFELEENASASRWIQPVIRGEWKDAAIVPEELAQKCYASELRRALFLWPDGFDWRGEGDMRSAELECDGTLGLDMDLLAQLGSNGRPVRVCVASDGGAWDAYEDIAWREARGRWWPASMTLVRLGEPVWTETVESVDAAVHYLDEFFIPPDRRAAHAGTVRIDLPAGVVRRVALPERCDWSSARAAAAKLAGPELDELVRAGWKPEAGTWYELDDAGRPVACLLRLRSSSKPTPSGWQSVAESTAVVAGVAQLDGEHAETLQRLRAALPAAAKPSATLAREFPGDSGKHPQIVIALQPAP